MNIPKIGLSPMFSPSRHMKTIGTEEDPKRFECEICGKQLYYVVDGLVHFDLFHKE